LINIERIDEVEKNLNSQAIY